MGQPLISNAAMQAMYHVMQRLRDAKQDPEVTEGLGRAERNVLRDQPESMLAAVLSQMHHRDTLVVQGAPPLLQTALAASFAVQTAAPAVTLFSGDSAACAALAAGMAAQQKLAERGTGPHRVTVALLQDLPAIPGVLRFMEQKEPSLILIAAGGEAEGRADAQRRLLSTRVPVMPVDHADAVALCRVMQESMLRARNGWGGVLIHATAMPGSMEPLLLMEQHLRNRKLIP